MKKLLLALGAFLFCVPAHAAVAHVTGGCSTAATHGAAASGVITFSCTPSASGDAITIGVVCTGNSTPSAVSLTATGWTITSLSGVVGSTSSGFTGLFAAIAPNTSATTFTATFTGATTCGGFTAHIADEFSGNDQTGGTTTFDAHNTSSGTGSCTVSVTPANNNDGISGFCFDSATAAGSGYTLSGNDGSGDRSEWKILTGGSGVAQTVNFTGSGAYDMLAATIKPSGGAPVTPLKRKKVGWIG